MVGECVHSYLIEQPDPKSTDPLDAEITDLFSYVILPHKKSAFVQTLIATKNSMETVFNHLMKSCHEKGIETLLIQDSLNNSKILMDDSFGF